jgi:hypothetical protein
VTRRDGSGDVDGPGPTPAGLLPRRAVVFVGGGFRAVPGTGENPAGLVVAWAFLLGFGLTVVGAGLLGVGRRRLDQAGSLADDLLRRAGPRRPRRRARNRVTPATAGRGGPRPDELAFVLLALGRVALGRLLFVTAGER